jgi:hypothetical protein
MAFLELAFVEVSSDGINYYRFPSLCNVPNNTQIPGSGVYTDARLINNLAGKYISMHGTPFDLSELSTVSGLDVNNITHVRLIDVVGSISGHTSVDGEGKIINDPYPTNFPTGGFDLDAVGVIHQYNSGIAQSNEKTAFHIFPVPSNDAITVSFTQLPDEGAYLSLTSVTGNLLYKAAVQSKTIDLSLQHYLPGIYYLTYYNSNNQKWVERIVKY